MNWWERIVRQLAMPIHEPSHAERESGERVMEGHQVTEWKEPGE